MEPIDIIVPYVNNSDPIWIKEFNKYKHDNGLKNEERFRDLHLFKYFFRSIERNCPWCRYIFLVLSGPSQIPKWLNVNHPKLKIVYHKDYIPEEFLPTFNSNVIELFYYRIEELSENFIICNDDMFFMKNVSFFENDKPKLQKKIMFSGLWPLSGDKCFVETINNNSKLISEMFRHKPITYFHYHVPTAHKKSLHAFIWHKYNDRLYNSLKNSRFRTSRNYTQWLFEDIEKITNKCIDTNIYSNTKVFTMESYLQNIARYDLICFNDGGKFNSSKVMSFIKQMEKIFPNASSFEV